MVEAPSAQRARHRRAFFLMIAAALMWSIGGIVSRQIEGAQGFERTMWRSLFSGIGILCLWPFIHKDLKLKKALSSGWAVWISGVCWAVMFTCFMVSISMTTVANVMVVQSLGPVFTVLLSWLWLKQKISARLLWVIVVAAAGIATMFIADTQALKGKHWIGVLIALGIPAAAAVNLNLMQVVDRKNPHGVKVDFIAALLVGSMLSVVATLAFAYPFQATGKDLGWLALLGFVQLAIPCAICIIAARDLPPAEFALLTLLEVIFGITWATLFTAEKLTLPTLIGGAMVLGALAINEFLNLRRDRVA